MDEGRLLSNTIRPNGQNIRGGEEVRGGSPEKWTAKSGFAERDGKPRFFEGGFGFLTGDADVGDIQLVLGEFGTKDDEAPVSVGGYNAFRITSGEEAVFALYKVVTKTTFEHAGEGQTLF